MQKKRIMFHQTKGKYNFRISIKKPVIAGKEAKKQKCFCQLLCYLKFDQAYFHFEIILELEITIAPWPTQMKAPPTPEINENR